MTARVRRHPALAPWTLERGPLRTLGLQLHAQYHDAAPYPHVVVDDFLGDEVSAELARAFPPPDHPRWKRRDYPQQRGRLGQLQRGGLDDVDVTLRWLLAELGSLAFLDFLGALTGRDDLIADPRFTGAGPMATLPGGHLALHADFNRDTTRRLDRVLSVLYYVPRRWEAGWGGALELWDRQRTRCEVAIAPIRDRLVVMAHGDDHWHGHPAPLACPPGEHRAVVGAYYYAARALPGDDAGAHGAIWA